MLLTKRCLKCGAVSEVDAGDATAACGKCGAIFAKVESVTAAKAAASPLQQPDAAMKDATASVQAPPAMAATSPRFHTKVSSTSSDARATFASGERPFLAGLRATTNYPTFRAVINFFYWFWIVLAALAALGTIISLFRDPGATTVIGGVLAVAFLVFVGRLLREVSMMLADIGDATIYTAERSQTLR
jgi:hypothetical protein